MNNECIYYDYNILFAKYENDLVHNLRDFNSKDPNIALWMPSVDTIESILSLCESIKENSVFKYLNLKINPNNIENDKDFNIDDLNNYFKDIQILKKSVIYEIKFNLETRIYLKKEIKNSNQIKKIKKFQNVEKINFEELFQYYLKNEILEGYNNEVKKMEYIENEQILNIASNNSNIEMYMSVKKIDHTVFDFIIKHNDNRFNPLLNYFCKIMEGLPLNEVVDHGVIILENNLRPNKINKSVSGIIIPSKQFDFFKLLQENLDIIFEKYVAINQIQFDDYYDHGVSYDWKKKNISEKNSIIERAIQDYLIGNSLEINLINLDKIEFSTKINISFNKNLSSKNKICLDLEKHLKKNVDVRLELFYKEMIDQNKLRVKNSPI